MTFDKWLEDTLFRPMNVNNQSTIMVHSAFKQLSKQDVQIESFCQFLQRYFFEGNVIMPTMTWRTVTPEKNTFDLRTTPSHTGVLSEIFRTQFATHRSLHPTHSVSAWGKAAQVLTASHHLASGPCSENSPYGIIENSDLLSNTYILCLGVALESCTYIHHFEELFAPDIYLEDTKEAYTLIDHNAHNVEYLAQRHTKRVRDFHQFGLPLFQNKDLLLAQYGNCDITLVRAKALSKLIRTSFAISPMATLAHAAYQTELS
ncbi:AAC(3) family N-acetyltransferase [Pseudoalteromonas luteoviolacea]|uniref:Aminoglycoside N(3)-acetyltransferase n=1 Tax=Pseudoalteromonas luteoviolacea H33 TaxID=1365251 RepID=A0A167C3C1_9GAMM|nr:AAC(3) family N-acetyltransferase [Pseudoalteromonas luteoviolacea]KZN47188.1 hypothetical protein N476_23705 [Pseudoalteromonas luteoviolacea H33]KZN77196.1 hypothetical protein N477_12485 [Pseudoalteromonas luteoviolacea H33-S]MBQ4879349.1 AAC(3) family N-acetyltransferase [Pseudoalteromonas luteoviolacea]MBQ4908409.1 AAC(3) family N-acetyltransferase [Pseudoalteromonas luteoviolacea]